MIWESDGHLSPNYSQRSYLYGVGGIPHVQFNGTVESIGGGTNMYPYYLNIYNQLINDESPIDIDLVGYTSGENAVELVADIVMTEDIQPSNVKIIFILTYKYNNEYFCTVEEYHEEVFELSHYGESGTYEHTFTLQNGWNIDNVSGVVMIQNLSGNHQIYQSAMTGEFGDPSIMIPYMYYEGWTTVGLPVIAANTNYQYIFPDAIENTMFSFDDGYELETNLVNGEGYWLRFSDQGYTTYTGFELEEITIQLEEGWNMISGISEVTPIHSIFDPYELIIPNTIYNFVEGYNLVDELEPGRGYWLRSSGNGDIMVSLDGNNNNLPRLVDRTGNLNVIKINGKSLYFGGDIPKEELLSYSLPPVPPGYAQDIRFTGDTRYLKEGGLIRFNGLNELKISYNILDGETWKVFNPKTGTTYKMEGTGNISIDKFDNFLNIRKN